MVCMIHTTFPYSTVPCITYTQYPRSPLRGRMEQRGHAIRRCSYRSALRPGETDADIREAITTSDSVHDSHIYNHFIATKMYVSRSLQHRVFQILHDSVSLELLGSNMCRVMWYLHM